MVKNRTVSLLIILVVYALAIAGGIFSYNYFSGESGLVLSYPIALFLSDVVATVIVFIFSLLFRNASVYDPYWSVQPPVIISVLLLKMHEINAQSSNGGQIPLLAWLLFAAILFWGLRLTANWAYNFKSFEYQDWRYVMLKEKSGRFYGFINFTGIHLFPTCVVFLCVLPAVIAIKEGASFKPLCALFIAVSFLAPVFQGIADIQMHRFRNSGTKGFIRTGLWKNSRHPNYACEILMWWGIGLTSVTALGGKICLLSGALINTLMFLFVSIPMAEKRQARKEGFEEYKKQTRMLF